MATPTNYIADYYCQKLGVGSRTRTTIVGSVSQHLQGATTESAVLNYLKKNLFTYGLSLSFQFGLKFSLVFLHEYFLFFQLHSI